MLSHIYPHLTDTKLQKSHPSPVKANTTNNRNGQQGTLSKTPNAMRVKALAR